LKAGIKCQRHQAGKTRIFMNTKFQHLLLVLVLLAGLQVNAITFTVTPSSTSNTYSGFITLQIGGLTNGESAVVQRFLDYNSNGVVDANEPLIDTFPISDGGASVIGGITNVSVPYDQNPATGAITTTLNFALPLNFENVSVPSVYRVITPTGQATATFVVTNAVQNQTISGFVYSGIQPVTNAMIVANVQPSGGLEEAVISDGTGHYTLNLPVGIYKVFALATNCYIDQSVSPLVTLTNTMSSTNNLYMTNGTVTISGTVYDATNTSLGLGAVNLILQSGNFLAAVFTSSNGTYSTAVSPGYWTPAPEEVRLARRGYVVPQNIPQINTTTGSVANANIALPLGNALFYGRITDGANHPFANVEWDANDDNGNSGLFDCRGFSDTNGYYGVAVLAETNSWDSSPDPIENKQFANDIISQGASQTFSAGQAVREDFTVLPANGQITGWVLDNSGHPVVGVELGASANIGGNNYQSSSVDTDTNGYYSLAVATGTWSVFFGANSDSQENPLTHNLEDLFGPYSVSNPPTNAVQNITLYPLGVAVLKNGILSSPGEFDLNVYGQMNANYTLESSPDLIHWSSLYSFQLTSNPFFISDTSATNSTGFYRVELVP
jgi:hypothetical protein